MDWTRKLSKKEKKIISLENKKDSWTKAKLAQQLYALFPDRKHALGLDQNYFMQMRSDMRNLNDFDAADQNLYRFALIATSICAIFPEYRQNVQISKNDIKRISEQLQQIRETNRGWDTFTSFAISLLLTTADEVRLTEQGYEPVSRPAISTLTELPIRNITA